MKTIRSIAELPSPSETSISVITPAKVCAFLYLCEKHEKQRRYQITLGILEQAKALDVPALWIQPGAEDEAVVNYIKENGLESKVIYGGPCILVEGDGILKSLL